MNPGKSISLDWKQFLRLGEEILTQESVTAQCKLIQDTLASVLNASVHVWLSEPFYPLPGETNIDTLPSDLAPSLVQESFRQRVPLFLAKTSKSATPRPGKFNRAAFPLITKNDQLGVIHIELNEPDLFTKAQLDFLEGAAAHAAVALQTSRQVSLKNWRFDQLALVRSVSAQIANQHDLDELCKHVTRLIQDAFDYYYVSLFTLEEKNLDLHFRASATSLPGITEPIRLEAEIGDGIIGTVAQTGTEIVALNVHHEPRYRYMDILPETISEVSLPLKVGSRILGVLDLQSNVAKSFHDFDMIVLRALADNIATAIESTRLLGGLEKRASQISGLLDISYAITSILDFETLMDEVVHSIQKYFKYPFVHLFIVHPGRRKIFYEAGSGERSRAFEEHQVTYDLDDQQGIIPWVARNGRTLLANNVGQEPRYRPSTLPPSNTLAELAIPLEYAGEILGVLDIQSDILNAFDEGDIPLLEALGSSIAIAIRNARLYRAEVWRRQVADSFREIAGLVSANIALTDLLERILTELDKNLPCEASAIWLLENQTSPDGSIAKSLKLAATHGLDPDLVNRCLQESDETRGFLERAIGVDSPTIRTAADPLGPIGKALNFPQNYSSIAAPLRAGGEELGILALAHSTSGRYGGEAGLISMTFANHAAVAIQNNRLFSTSQEQAWISTILLQVAEATQASMSVDELLDTMARLTPLLVGIKKCAVFVWDENNQVFTLKAQYGLGLSEEYPLTFSRELPAAEQLVSTHTAVFIQNPEMELNLPNASLPGDNSTLVILPLLSHGNILGAYLVAHQRDEQNSPIFDENTFSLLQGIAHQTAVALENLQLMEARQEEAYVTAVMLQVAQAVVSQQDLADILDTIVHLMPILIGIDACAFYIWDENRGEYRVEKAHTGSLREEKQLETLRYRAGDFPFLDHITEADQLLACKISNPELPIDQWNQLNCLIPIEEIPSAYTSGTNWVIGVPLSIKGEVFGVLMAKEANVPASFHQRRLELITGIAQQVALAIQNEQLNLEMVKRERLEQEIQLARQIQKTFLPSRLPKVPGWELEIDWKTAREVGGDFYDVFKLGKNRLGIVIADVSDKGMPAALYMTVARTLIRAFVQNIESPARVLERVNRLILGDTQDGLFVTAVYAVLDLGTNQLTYSNAGHNLPLLIRCATCEVEPLPKGGMALGILADNRLEDHQIDVCPGDTILFYTDGLTDTFSPSGEAFGDQRLRESLTVIPQPGTQKLLTHINREVDAFRNGAPQSDDLTLVLLHRLENPEP